MPSKVLTVNNKLGIHARPAAQFVKIASRFSCSVRVEKDEEEALAEIEALLERNFEEK